MSPILVPIAGQPHLSNAVAEVVQLSDNGRGLLQVLVSDGRQPGSTNAIQLNADQVRALRNALADWLETTGR